MKKLLRTLLAWALALSCVLTCPGVGVFADTIIQEKETLNAEATEEEKIPELTVVRFECEPADAVISVFAGEETLEAEEDGSYVLQAGEYTYVAEKEGYVTSETAFTVEEGTEEMILTVALEEAAEEVAEEPEETVEETTEVVEETTETVEETTEVAEETTETVEETTEVEEETTEVTEETTEEETTVEETTVEETTV